ncbi:hypothetical protein F7725_023780 [Dissostichus mawsoni]|uniref:Uncharacterized protein n=1 Tax=Dissostichus mawsoni TaxID=36200 RepID=A0A7J5XZ21_DISMA|nr:hypothetical protein F7725_023780 [Dissostichus mawsoni]
MFDRCSSGSSDSSIDIAFVKCPKGPSASHHAMAANVSTTRDTTSRGWGWAATLSWSVRAVKATEEVPPRPVRTPVSNHGGTNQSGEGGQRRTITPLQSSDEKKDKSGEKAQENQNGEHEALGKKPQDGASGDKPRHSCMKTLSHVIKY